MPAHPPLGDKTHKCQHQRQSSQPQETPTLQSWVGVQHQPRGFFDQSQVCSPDLSEHNFRERMALPRGQKKGKPVAFMTSGSLGRMQNCGESKRTNSVEASRTLSEAMTQRLCVRRPPVTRLHTAPLDDSSLNLFSGSISLVLPLTVDFLIDASVTVTSNSLV